jgi:hypothetical protein
MTEYAEIWATRAGIAHYLNENYHISVEAARALVDSQTHKQTVEDAIKRASRNYYPGDRIAEIADLAPRPFVILRGEELTEFLAIVSASDIGEIRLSVIADRVRVRINEKAWSRELGLGSWER